MNILLFLVIIVVSFVAVRIGAIAFQLTGLEWSLAKFQALSCFTGTGFTTRESEMITRHPQRRRIASVLMVLGNAGLVTLIATFANSLRPIALSETLQLPFVHVFISSGLLPWINLLIIIVVLYVFYRMATYTRFTRRLTEILKKYIIKQDVIRQVSFEELVVSTDGYGITSIEVYPDNPYLNKTLQESDLRGRDISVVAIERGSETITNPMGKVRIKLNDRLLCFGKIDNIRMTLSGPEELLQP